MMKKLFIIVFSIFIYPLYGMHSKWPDSMSAICKEYEKKPRHALAQASKTLLKIQDQKQLLSFCDHIAFEISDDDPKNLLDLKSTVLIFLSKRTTAFHTSSSASLPSKEKNIDTQTYQKVLITDEKKDREIERLKRKLKTKDHLLKKERGSHARTQELLKSIQSHTLETASTRETDKLEFDQLTDHIQQLETKSAAFDKLQQRYDYLFAEYKKLETAILQKSH